MCPTGSLAGAQQNHPASACPPCFSGTFERLWGIGTRLPLREGDRHPGTHGHSVNSLDLLAGAPCQLDLLKAKRRWGRLARPPGTLEILYQLSPGGRHLPQRWTQLHVPHSGPPQYGVPTICRLHRNVSGPGAYCDASHHVQVPLTPASP